MGNGIETGERNEAREPCPCLEGRHLTAFGDVFGCHNLDGPQTSSEERPEMLRTISQGTGQPPP